MYESLRPVLYSTSFLSDCDFCRHLPRTPECLGCEFDPHWLKQQVLSPISAQNPPFLSLAMLYKLRFDNERIKRHFAVGRILILADRQKL